MAILAVILAFNQCEVENVVLIINLAALIKYWKGVRVGQRGRPQRGRELHKLLKLRMTRAQS